MDRSARRHGGVRFAGGIAGSSIRWEPGDCRCDVGRVGSKSRDLGSDRGYRVDAKVWELGIQSCGAMDLNFPGWEARAGGNFRGRMCGDGSEAAAFARGNRNDELERC
jgi:hypothetical protein